MGVTLSFIYVTRFKYIVTIPFVYDTCCIIQKTSDMVQIGLSQFRDMNIFCYCLCIR
jgi:hypothetical protein